MADGGGRRELRLAIAVDGPEPSGWLEAFDFAAFQVRPVPVRWDGAAAAAGAGEIVVRSRGLAEAAIAEVPDLGDMLEGLARERVDAVLLLSGGVLSRLARFAADLVGIPVFNLVMSAEELALSAARPKSRPDLEFLADAELFPEAALDPRYGLTVLPTGHPGRDLHLRGRTNGGPDFSDARFGDGRAAARILEAIRGWDAASPPPAPDLSVIVPAYKEAANLPKVCQKLVETFASGGLRAEIILVDDSSPDRTYAVALEQMWRSPMIRALKKPTPHGMGNGIRYGLARARSRYVAVTMGDGSDEVTRIPDMLRKVREEGFSLAIGSRYRSRANYEAVPTLYRFWSWCFRLTTRGLIGFRLADYTNAFRLFDTRIFERYGPESGGFEISPEITFKAWLATKRVAEVDVRHLKRASGQSNFSFLRAGPGYGRILIKAFVARLTGRWFTLFW